MRRRGESKVATLSRKVMERNRRILTKDLFSKLSSLINPTPLLAPKWTSIELLDEATAHVKQLQERIEMLKRRKQQLQTSKSTVFTVTDLESTVEVCLACRSNEKLILTRVIDVLEEEAGPVVAVSYSREDDKINYIIYSQAVCSRIGIDSSRVHERLKRLTAC